VTTSDQNVIWLTQEAHDKLQAELEHLRGPVRNEVIQRISAARDEGDLKENGGYHAAREEQGKIEGRIRQLEDMLRRAERRLRGVDLEVLRRLDLARAEVGETPQDDGVVEPGMKVTTRFVGDDEEEVFLLGAREIETPEDLEVYSPQSPLGAAIIGRKKGEEVDFEAPNGKVLKVEIVDAVPYKGA
jgi:transcription elongation factor GreA